MWAKEREIRVTASNFGRIYKLRPTTAIAKTVESLLYSTFRGNSHTYYGQQSEEKAVKCFEINKNIKTERCGLFISKQFPYLAASPDRVLEDRSGLVEIKCPSKSQDLCPEEAIRKKKSN
ncbi:lambda exonuclease family protein, partial [Enterobacter cloacae complex sp. 2DZ2F20B]|uniref:lambda exonuclease family protein n=1 Tax=Enterobacter cloacae complex sp. 2DZ2F20B TaxID=2511993 RepID=UPI00102723B9